MTRHDLEAEVKRLRNEVAAERAAHAETRKMLGDLLARPVAPAPIVLPQPAPHVSPWPALYPDPDPFIIPPVAWPTTGSGTYTVPTEKCAFDGLPPGVYGLVCFCPKCTPRFTVGDAPIPFPGTTYIGQTDPTVTHCTALPHLAAGTLTVANPRPPDAPLHVPSCSISTH